MRALQLITVSTLVMVSVFCWNLSPAQAQEGSSPAADAKLLPVGKWKTFDEKSGKPKAVVRIFRAKNGSLNGNITKLYPLPGVEENATCLECKGPLQGKPIVGLQILRGLNESGDEWTGGTILDPENGETYKCTIKVIDQGAKLQVRGFMGVALLGRTQLWERIE